MMPWLLVSTGHQQPWYSSINVTIILSTIVTACCFGPKWHWLSMTVAHLGNQIKILTCFANNVIDPWPQIMWIFGRNNASWIHTSNLFKTQFCLYLYFGTTERQTLQTKFRKFVTNSPAKFGEKLSDIMTAWPHELNHIWINIPIFQDVDHPSSTWMLGRKHQQIRLFLTVQLRLLLAELTEAEDWVMWPVFLLSCWCSLPLHLTHHC